MAIVRFGADEIFRSSAGSSDAGVTDADIDAILAQVRTARRLQSPFLLV